MLVLVDADSIVYKAGFAVETASYEAIAEDDWGTLKTRSFDSRQELDDWLAEIGADPAFATTTVYREAEPVENAIQIVKTILQDIQKETRATALSVFLTGKQNYRDLVATIKPYKGNRDKLHKPIHYDAMRHYLQMQWGASVSDGNEADDEVSIAARKQDCIVAAIDKDLDQIPGRHYDYGKKIHFEVTEEQAEEQFWLQVLQGDPSDNVGGVYRMGPKAAEKWLQEWDFYCGGSIWACVLAAYQQSQEKKGCPYADMDPEDAALENARLVYLQQKPGELWLPHGERAHVAELYE